MPHVGSVVSTEMYLNEQIKIPVFLDCSGYDDPFYSIICCGG